MPTFFVPRGLQPSQTAFIAATMIALEVQTREL
jgi:hypothetical protein